MRTCSHCEQNKPIEEFSVVNRTCRRTVCMSCVELIQILRRFEFKDSMKGCSVCGVKKICGVSFNGARNTRDGYQSVCKECQSSSSRLKHSGWTAEEFEEVWEEQDGKCAICQEELQEGKLTAADHCHTTGSKRGILCTNCNQGLGRFKDNPELLRRAADYLELHTTIDVIKSL